VIIHFRPLLDLINRPTQPALDRAAEVVGIWAGAGVEEDGEGAAVGAAHEHGGGSGEGAAVVGVALAFVAAGVAPPSATIVGAAPVATAAEGVFSWRCEHFGDRRFTENFALLWIVVRAAEADQIDGGRDPAAVRVHRFDIPAAICRGDALAQFVGEDTWHLIGIVIANLFRWRVGT